MENRQNLDSYFYQNLNRYKRELFNNSVTGFHYTASIVNATIDEAAWEGFENDMDYMKNLIDEKLKKAMIWNYKDRLFQEAKMNKDYFLQLIGEKK